MTTHPKDVVAVLHQALAFDEGALKQIAVLFSRLAFFGLSNFESLPDTGTKPAFIKHLTWLNETGILFEPELQKSDDQDFKNRMLHDIEQLFKPVGLSAEDFLAARQDEEKAKEFKIKARHMGPALMSGAFDLAPLFEAIQRMTMNMTRYQAIQLRNFNNLDAHAIVPDEFNSLEQDDEHVIKHDVVRIVIAELPVPDRDVSWEQIFEYRNDPNSLDRFLDLRNWISDTARGKFTLGEVEERLGPVLKRFRKQMELHQLKTATTTLEAFVTTTADVIRSLFVYGANTTFMGLCSLEQRKLALLEGESTAPGSEIAYVLGTSFLQRLATQETPETHPNSDVLC